MEKSFLSFTFFPTIYEGTNYVICFVYFVQKQGFL